MTTVWISDPKARYDRTPAPPNRNKRTIMTPVKTAGNLRGSRMESVMGMTCVEAAIS
jgi:hypothetical protein